MWMNERGVFLGSKLLINHDGSILSVKVKSMTRDGLWLESYNEKLGQSHIDRFFKSQELVIVGTEGIEENENN